MAKFIRNVIRNSSAIESMDKVAKFFEIASYRREPEMFDKSIELDKHLTKEGIRLGDDLHKVSTTISKEQHAESVNLARQIHFREMTHDLEEHFHQLNADLIYATREAERSMYDQRNAEFQTIIISSTVMFAGLSDVIIQGYLPHPATRTNGLAVIYVLMAGACGLSFAFLFICIVFFMKIVIRTSKFMYRRAYRQTERFSRTITKSVDIMRQLRDVSDMEKWNELNKKVHSVHDDIIMTFLVDERVHKVISKEVKITTRKSMADLNHYQPSKPTVSTLGQLARAFSMRRCASMEVERDYSVSESSCLSGGFTGEMSTSRTKEGAGKYYDYGSVKTIDLDSFVTDLEGNYPSPDVENLFLEEEEKEEEEERKRGKEERKCLRRKGLKENQLDREEEEEEEEKEWVPEYIYSEIRDNDLYEMDTHSARVENLPPLKPLLDPPYSRMNSLQRDISGNTASSVLFFDDGDIPGEDLESDWSIKTFSSGGRTNDTDTRKMNTSAVSSIDLLQQWTQTPLIKKKKKKNDIRPGSFEHFYDSQCQFYAWLAVWLYYLGTSAFLIACAVFMYAQFSIVYKCLAGAIISVIFIGVSLVIGLLIIVYMEEEPTDDMIEGQGNDEIFNSMMPSESDNNYDF